jgi:LytS/YehU family sensor histidine kinase
MHYSNPVENAHMYMLEDFDPNWRRADNERTAYYFNVPPGNYVFRVKASNSEEVWAERSIKVVIVPAWWNTWYFRVPALLVLIGLLYLVVRWRTLQLVRRQLERAATERELADLRHRSAMLEMQALRSQMNPHFIFNSLNSINHFILQNNKQSASAYLTKFSRLVRLILQHSEHAMIPLENELQALQLYLDLEAVRFDNQFTYRLRVSDELNTDLIRVPPLIFQPFAENAIWHGLMHKDKKGHLDIFLASKDGMLVCTISDDGIGRKRANELQSKSAAKHRSMGMKITAGRIEMLRHNNNAQANVTVNDLVLPDGSAGGTEVIIKIPLHYDKGHNS